jgi:hypothetical protein
MRSTIVFARSLGSPPAKACADAVAERFAITAIAVQTVQRRMVIFFDWVIANSECERAREETRPALIDNYFAFSTDMTVI